MPADREKALVAVADELYALPPEEFTNARNARAKAAQSDGDRDLAAAIRGLAKPSAAAWLANQLVRRDRAALDPLLELGASLRDATARLDGAEMRALSRQQGKLVAGLVRRAGELGTPSGKPMSPGVAQDLDDTLRAAIADADAADQLMAGRLANSLQHNGFGLVAPGNLSLVSTSSTAADRGKAPAKSGTAKAGRAGKSATSSRDNRRAEQLAAAERDVADAQAGVEVTEAGQARAADDLETAEQTLAEAKATLDQLREELERAKFAVSRAEGGLRQAKQSLEQVNRAARAARNGLDDAVAKRDRLRT
jgi:uncharacterized phage infection (PIP) family protein YhgE